MPLQSRRKDADLPQRKMREESCLEAQSQEDQLDGVVPPQAPQRHGRRNLQEEDAEDAEVHESRHRRHSRRHHGQEEPKAGSQKGAERASGPRRQGEEGSERGEEGEESGSEAESSQGQDSQGGGAQSAQGQDRRRKTLRPADRWTHRRTGTPADRHTSAVPRNNSSNGHHFNSIRFSAFLGFVSRATFMASTGSFSFLK